MCNQVVAELNKLKFPPAAPAATQILGAAPLMATAGLSGAGLSSEALEMDEVDPVEEEAVRATHKTLERVQFYDDFNQLVASLPALVNPSEAVLILVEAPTSKMRANIDLFEQAMKLAEKITNKKVCLLMNSGLRLDLASAMYNKGEALLSAYRI